MVSRLIDSHGFKTAIYWSILLVGCYIIAGVICYEGPFLKRIASIKEREAIANPSFEPSKSDENYDIDDLGRSCSVKGLIAPK